MVVVSAVPAPDTEIADLPSGATARRSWLPPGRSRTALLLLAPAAVLALAVVVYPVLEILLRGFSQPEWGLQNVRTVFFGPGYLAVVWNTLVISFTVTVISLLLAYPFAYSIAVASPAVRRMLLFFVLVPFWTSALVRTFAWMVLLQKTGLINGWMMQLGIISEPLSLIYNRTGVLIGMTHVLLPFMVMPIFAVMSRIDANLTRAASSLGATPARNFVRVYLPLSMPGVLGGCALVFTMSLGFFVTPSLLGGPRDTMIALVIQRQIGDFGQWGVAGIMSLILILVTAAAFALVPFKSAASTR